MGDGQLWVLASRLISLLDITNFGTKDWLQVLAAIFAIVGYTYGLWKAFRFSKRQIAKRLLEYLEGEGVAIKEARNAVIRHVRLATPLAKHLCRSMQPSRWLRRAAKHGATIGCSSAELAASALARERGSRMQAPRSVTIMQPA